MRYFGGKLTIAKLMIKEGCDPEVVSKACKMATEYEGTYDLMCLWHECDISDKQEAFEAIKEEVERWTKNLDKVNST
jgi:hypothetical protein